MSWNDFWQVENAMFAVADRIVVYVAVFGFLCSIGYAIWAAAGGRLRASTARQLAILEQLSATTRPPSAITGRVLVEFDDANASVEGSWEHYVYTLRDMAGEQFRHIFVRGPRVVAGHAEWIYMMSRGLGYLSAVGMVAVGFLSLTPDVFSLSFLKIEHAFSLLSVGSGALTAFVTYRVSQRAKLSRDVALAYLKAMDERGIMIGMEFTRNVARSVPTQESMSGEPEIKRVNA